MSLLDEAAKMPTGQAGDASDECNNITGKDASWTTPKMEIQPALLASTDNTNVSEIKKSASDNQQWALNNSVLAQQCLNNQDSILSEPPKQISNNNINISLTTNSSITSSPTISKNKVPLPSSPNEPTLFTPPLSVESGTPLSTSGQLSGTPVSRGSVAARVAMFKEQAKEKERNTEELSSSHGSDNKSNINSASGSTDQARPISERMTMLKLQMEAASKVSAATSSLENRLKISTSSKLVSDTDTESAQGQGAGNRPSLSPGIQKSSPNPVKNLLGDRGEAGGFMNELALKLNGQMKPGNSPSRPVSIALTPPVLDVPVINQLIGLDIPLDEDLFTTIKSNSILNMKELELYCGKKGEFLFKTEKNHLNKKPTVKQWGPCIVIPCSTYLILTAEGYDPIAVRPLGIIDIAIAKLEYSGKGIFKKASCITLTLSSGMIFSLYPSPNNPIDFTVEEWATALTTHIETYSSNAPLKQLVNIIKQQEIKPSKSEIKEDKTLLATTSEDNTASQKPDRSASVDFPKSTGRSQKLTSSGRPKSFLGLLSMSSSSSSPSPSSQLPASPIGSGDKSEGEGQNPTGIGFTYAKSSLARFFRHRPTIEALQEKGIIQQDMLFGGLLELQVSKTGRKIPVIVEQCVNRVEEKGLKTVGIYRLSGNSNAIQKLRLAFNDDRPVDLNLPDYDDINIITGTLKLYFRELAEPLLTKTLFTDFIKSVRAPIDSRPTTLRELVRKLPASHYNSLEYMIKHLARVATAAPTTKMEASNLAIVFGPTLLRPPVENAETLMNTDAQNEVIKEMIVNCEKIFIA